MKKPKQLEDKDINLDELRLICKKYIDFNDNDEEFHEDNDFDNYIFEKAMELLYGTDVWEWINTRQP